MLLLATRWLDVSLLLQIRKVRIHVTFSDASATTCWHTEAGLREALPHLLTAEADYVRLSMFEATSDVQWLLMVVFHNLGMKEEEKAVLERYSASMSAMQSSEESALDGEAQQVWDLVTDVGLSLAGR